MTDASRPWWARLTGRGRTDAEEARAGGSPAEEQAETLRTAVRRLRRLLRDERARLRPDTWNRSSDMVERTAELLPQWEELSAGRASEALVVEDVVYRHLPRRLEAFLAVPDSQKPAAAPELLEQLEDLERSHLRAVRRLHAVTRIRLESLGELHGDDQLER